MVIFHPSIDPIIFRIGPIDIYWYGLMYVVAFASAFILGRFRLSSQPWLGIDNREFDDLLFFGVIGVILGGRIGYILFYKPLFLIDNPLKIFYVWEGGMSFHGGLIGVLMAMVLFCARTKKKWLEVMDFVAPLVPTGLAAGRLGNFINAELWGRPTGVEFGMIFPTVDQTPRHPSQLYEFFLEGIVLFVILWFFSSKRRKIGQVSAWFLVCYGGFRFVIEYTRAPDAHLGLLFMNLSMGQFLSIPMVIAGLLLLKVANGEPSQEK